MFAFDTGDTHLPSSHTDKPLFPSIHDTQPETRGIEDGGEIRHDTSATQPSEINDIGGHISRSSPQPFVTPTPCMLPHEKEFNDTISSSLGTPPIDIVMTPSTWRSQSRSRDEEEVAKTLTSPTSKLTLPVPKPGRKKKKNPRRGAIAALNMVRGFTPATSGDEDSEFSNGRFGSRGTLSTQRSSSIIRKDLDLDGTSNVESSPIIRSCSPSPGISALTQQLEILDYNSASERGRVQRDRSKLASENPSSASVTSATTSDDDTATEMTSYEVNLEHDFISPDVSQKEKRDARQDPRFNGGVVRKMQAIDFLPLRCLGKGTYGTVLLVKQTSTGKLYAQKQFRKASLTVRKQLVEQTKTERAILESINRHPFVVKLYYAFQDHEKLYLILEYAQGGELFERMRTERMFPEETAAFYMAEMVLALEHLHHNIGVVYRDLKPENCLLDSEGHLLLTDFGLSKVAIDGEHRCKSMTGTVEYMAPEVIQMQSYGTAVDWWSFGILGFDLLTGSTPFRANNDFKIKEKIQKSKLVLPYFLSPDAKDLLTRLLRKEPKKRLGANMPKDLHTIKNHRFFRKIDWAKLDRRELEPPIKPLITDPELAENFSADFTGLALSPVVPSPLDSLEAKSEHDPFGGFSFVGSRSLLESGNGFF